MKRVNIDNTRSQKKCIVKSITKTAIASVEVINGRSFSEVEIVEHEKPECIDSNVLIPGRQLLKHKEISDLRIQISGKLITYSSKQPVLVEIIVHDIFAGIDVKFIVEEYKRGPRVNAPRR